MTRLLQWPFTIVVPTRGRAEDFARIVANFADILTTIPLIVVANRHFTSFTSGLSNRSNTQIIYAPGGGVSRARNVGIWAANTNIIVFVDDDVLPIMASLAILVDRLRFSNTGIATARIQSSDSEYLTASLYGEFFSLDRGPTSCTFSQHISGRISPMLVWSMGVGATFAINRECIRTITQPPIFDESLSNGRFCGGAEDVDFFLQCLQAGLIVEYCADAALVHQEARGWSQLHSKMIQYARADGAFYAKWRSELSVRDVIADLASWAMRVRLHTFRYIRGKTALPLVALLVEPLEKIMGAIWWCWTA